MGRFHVAPSDDLVQSRTEYTPDVDDSLPVPSIEIQTQIVEKIVEVVKEVKVPEYITVLKEIEVPVMIEVEKVVEKIIEVPSIRVVEKPITVIHEVYDVKPILLEKQAHERTKRKLHLAYITIAFSVLLLSIMAVK